MAILRILMPESLPELGACLAWERLDAKGNTVQSGFDPLADMPVAEQCQAVAPAAVVLLTSVKLPASKGEKARRLLPFVVEDQLAVEVDTVHFALGVDLPDGRRSVAVVNKHWMQQSLAFLTAEGLRVQHFFPETLLLALPEAGWVMTWDGQRGLVRTGEYAGCAVEGEGIPFALQCLCQSVAAHPPKQLLIYTHSALDTAVWSAQLGIPVVKSTQSAPSELSALDLLQGDFARQQFNWTWLPKLKPVLWLAAAMILLQLLGTGIDYWRLSREQRQLRQEMEASFRLAFPEATVVVDPALQMERQLATLRRTAGIADAQDFLPMLGKITSLLKMAEGTQLQKINYENQVLKLELSLPTATVLASLHTQVSQLACQTEWLAEGMNVRLKVWECR
ncbi:MAG: type II secretion system protein GspL [Gallionella sp.]|nr:type II secretion system protein GspL [Gallionella sp.]